jgi:hypothetical protein
MDDSNTASLDWSPWLDFNREAISQIAELEGVFKMHSEMKILFMGSGQNLRNSLLDCLSNPCVSKAKRFSYAFSHSSEKLIDELLLEYRTKHGGRLPNCMES